MQKLTIKTPDFTKIKIQLRELVKSIADFFKKLPQTIKNMPIPIKLAWSSIMLGTILIITALILMI